MRREVRDFTRSAPLQTPSQNETRPRSLGAVSFFIRRSSLLRFSHALRSSPNNAHSLRNGGVTRFNREHFREALLVSRFMRVLGREIRTHHFARNRCTNRAAA